jgi:hypothetical protein
MSWSGLWPADLPSRQRAPSQSMKRAASSVKPIRISA